MDYIDIFWVYLQVISAIVAKGVMISYLFVGTIATLFAVGFFFVTGITIFDEGKEARNAISIQNKLCAGDAFASSVFLHGVC